MPNPSSCSSQQVLFLLFFIPHIQSIIMSCWLNSHIFQIVYLLHLHCQIAIILFCQGTPFTSCFLVSCSFTLRIHPKLSLRYEVDHSTSLLNSMHQLLIALGKNKTKQSTVTHRAWMALNNCLTIQLYSPRTFPLVCWAPVPLAFHQVILDLKHLHLLYSLPRILCPEMLFFFIIHALTTNVTS